MSKPFIFRRPDESEDDAEKRLKQEAAETEEVRPELVGAPSNFAELQALAQEAHPVVLGSDERITFKHGDLVGEWARSEMIDGTGPQPGYYFRWVEPGPAVAHFTNQA